MGFGADQLRDKALMALEEALQEARYPPVRRSLALRFALAYLWSVSEADKKHFVGFWQALAERHPWSLSTADHHLAWIYKSLQLERDEAPMWHFWKKCAEAERERRDAEGNS
jgi:hypothetical protein